MASPSLQLAHFFVGLFVFLSGLGLSYWGTQKAPGKNNSVKFIQEEIEFDSKLITLIRQT